MAMAFGRIKLKKKENLTNNKNKLDLAPFFQRSKILSKASLF